MRNFYALNKTDISLISPAALFVASAIASRCGSATTADNRTELLNDGNRMFASLIGELHRARKSVHLEYYIFDDDRIGAAIADILIRKARAGVAVRLLCDAVGSRRLSKRTVRRMRSAGIELCIFGRFNPLRPFASLNIRNHRKIAVIDGRTAFIGGINIARRYMDGDRLGHWRDEHLRIEGSAADALQQLFAEDWLSAGGRPFDAARCRTAGDPQGRTAVQIGWAQSGRTRHTLTDAFTAAIVQARHDIMISTPYFIPPQQIRRALCTAAARGVRVRLMVPSRADMRTASLAGESYFGELLDAGVEIYLYDGGFLHSKTLVADSHIASVGTANMDFRSLCINWEVAAFVYDSQFCRTAAATFDRDLQSCRRLTLREHRARPLHRRIASKICRLFSRML